MPQSATSRQVRLAAIILAALLAGPLAAQGPPKKKWVQSKAYVVPKETATEGEGYFAIIEGHNGRLYIGTHANAVNSWLVEFDPAAERMKVVVDAHKAIGKDLKGFAAQAKIHTRNNVGASGKIYFGTKQGYPDTTKGEKREDYPGGYPMVYDPKTEKTKVYPIPVPHEGINSITPDESRGVAYISTCSDGRPGPGEGSHFLILDLKTGKYRNLIDTKHVYGFIVVDYLGRAYHPMLGGGIVRYDPKTDTLEHLKQTIDGKEATKESNLANSDVRVAVQKQNSPGGSAPLYQTQVAFPTGHPINWDISPDGKTLYSVPMSTNQLYAYDLSAKGDTLPGRSLGKLVPEAVNTDCRAMCVGPKGEVWVAVTGKVGDVDTLLNLVSYRPGDKAPRNHGPVAVSNPNYTEFKDKASKVLPFHGGLRTLSDGTVTTRYVILGVCQGKDGSVYMLMLHPYTVLKVTPQALAAVGDGARSRQGPKLFAAYPLTKENEFTAGIEGPACDAEGNVYAVNYAKQGTIGKVTPGGAGEVWVTLPGKSVGNGIVFDRKGMMYVADYVGHNVLRIDPSTKTVSVFAHEDRFNQPNDLAIAPDGTLYASDPNWGKSTGQVWKIDSKGKVTLAAGDMGTTNGIEVSPDGKTLYVNESVQRNIWAFTIGADGSLSNKRLLKKFEDFGFDGMRCDVDGNLYITRHGKGTVVVLSPAGNVLHEVKVLGKFPSNLCFGGQDGKTVYVTEVEHRRLVQFRADRPGLAWKRWQKGNRRTSSLTPDPSPQTPVVRVGIEEGDIRGSDHRAIQAAIDYVAGLGGGTVHIGPGRYSLRNAVTLRDNVHIVGTPGKTFLVPVDGVRVKLLRDGDANQRQITFADASSFRVGDRVLVSDDRNPSGFQVTSATLTARLGPKTFRLSHPLHLDYMVSRNARAELNFPAAGGWQVKNASVEHVIVEGNRGRTQCTAMDGCRTGGIYLFECENITIRDCTVRNYNGDGISFQVSQGVRVERCLAEDNAGLGLHPGSGSGRPVVRGNRSLNNGGDGLFVCWRVRHGLFEDNEVRGNQGVGISIGHKDTDNVFRNNRVTANGGCGLLFRRESEEMGAHRNVFEKNTFLDNGAAAKSGNRHAVVLILGHHHDLVFRQNIIGRSGSGDTPDGIVAGKDAKNLQAADNDFRHVGKPIRRAD